MLRKRRSLRFSILSLLERVWIRKRSRFELLRGDFPGLSVGVCWRNLNALHQGGLIKRHSVPKPGFPNFFYHYPAPRGRELLRHLYPYRDWWELVTTREIRILAAAERIFERLERERLTFLPDDRKKPPRWNYWLRGPAAEQPDPPAGPAAPPSDL